MKEHFYDEAHIGEMPVNANIISSHHLFEVKTQGTAYKLRLKCRFVPHSNQDNEKEMIRTDAVTAQFPVFWLLLSDIYGTRLKNMDIKSALLQG